MYKILLSPSYDNTVIAFAHLASVKTIGMFRQRCVAVDPIDIRHSATKVDREFLGSGGNILQIGVIGINSRDGIKGKDLIATLMRKHVDAVGLNGGCFRAPDQVVVGTVDRIECDRNLLERCSGRAVKDDTRSGWHTCLLGQRGRSTGDLGGEGFSFIHCREVKGYRIGKRTPARFAQCDVNSILHQRLAFQAVLPVIGLVASKTGYWMVEIIIRLAIGHKNSGQ